MGLVKRESTVGLRVSLFHFRLFRNEGLFSILQAVGFYLAQWFMLWHSNLKTNLAKEIAETSKIHKLTSLKAMIHLVQAKRLVL